MTKDNDDNSSDGRKVAEKMAGSLIRPAKPKTAITAEGFFELWKKKQFPDDPQMWDATTHDLLPSHIFLCNEEYAELRIKELSSASVPTDEEIRELAKTYVSYDRQLAVFGKEKADTVYQVAVVALIKLRDKQLFPILASKEQEMAELKQELKKYKDAESEWDEKVKRAYSEPCGCPGSNGSACGECAQARLNDPDY